MTNATRLTPRRSGFVLFFSMIVFVGVGIASRPVRLLAAQCCEECDPQREAGIESCNGMYGEDGAYPSSSALSDCLADNTMFYYGCTGWCIDDCNEEPPPSSQFSCEVIAYCTWPGGSGMCSACPGDCNVGHQSISCY